MTTEELRDHGIAIIGMNCRFPGAPDVETFWRNIRDGVESITFYSDDDLRTSGVDEDALRDPAYVKAGGALDGIELFDAGFFEYTPREAEMLDPQQRVFLECSWHALEHAGYDAQTYRGLIGMYAGSNISTYLLVNLISNPELIASYSSYQTIIANDKDYLPTRTSYKLNLKGPSLNINTACSTSLVAVHLACQSLLNGESDLALAGGVAINLPQRVGYWYREGSISSPDGHCRPFDSKAQGTISSSGVGVVVLKRLSDARNDGDTIHAIIRGSAINNDGAGKVGFTAPSVEGQAAVIEEALAVAQIEPDSIGYVETHGTATPLGDPIEIAALTQVFRAKTEHSGFCAIGSVKSNFGHTGAAAGMAGLIKAIYALKQHQLPPSLHFEKPNPKLDLDNSPFYVNATLAQWHGQRAPGGAPRRAGVSSFGIGGTNAHVILEEAPAPGPSDPGRPAHLLPISARTSEALDTATANLLAWLKESPEIDLADVAYTLQTGRHAFNYRRFLVCRDVADAVQVLEQMHPERVLTRMRESGSAAVVFMFPGQGAQYPNMARELYASEPKFRASVDRCAELLRPHVGRDIRELLYPENASDAEDLSQTNLTQPALFVIEYALARLLISWGVKPQAMIGHSIGEYVAATLAGVFSLEDALALVALRGCLIAELPSGGMLSVPLPEHQVADLLQGEHRELTLAAVNGPSLCVVSGPHPAIDVMAQELTTRGVECRRLHTSHAFHSAMMSPILTRFAEQVGNLIRKAPKIPFISNISGTWISTEQATDAEYWANHLRQTVRFGDGLQTLAQEPGRILLEVGPGRTLSTLAQQSVRAGKRIVVSSLRHAQDQQSDEAFLLSAIGKLWLLGVAINWQALYAGTFGVEQRRRIPLPLYPFERQRYWVEAQLLSRSIAPQIPGESPAAETQPSAEAPAFSLHPRPDLLVAYASPSTKLERKIAEIWQELLGVAEIGIHDNFFDLGGHSLMATQVISRLRQTFQVELPLERMLETTTIAQLAAVVQDTLIERVEALPEEEALMLLATLEAESE